LFSIFNIKSDIHFILLSYLPYSRLALFAFVKSVMMFHLIISEFLK